MAELQGLIRLAKASVDDRQRALAELLRQAEDLARQCLKIAKNVAREGMLAGKGSEGESVHFGPFVTAAIAQRRELEASARAVEAAIEAAREALAEDYRHLRALELANEARLRRNAQARARREQDTLDELALQRHQRATRDPQTLCDEPAGS